MKKNLSREFIAPGYRLEKFKAIRKQVKPKYEDGEYTGPMRMPMRQSAERGYDGRGFRIRNGALKRWLAAQAGKSWAQVRADIERAFPRKVDWHLKEVLLSYIEQKTFVDDAGEVLYCDGFGQVATQPAANADFYVDPVSGNFAHNPKERKESRKAWKKRYEAQLDEAKPKIIIQDEAHRLVQMDDIWYQLSLRAITDDERQQGWTDTRDAAGIPVSFDSHLKWTFYGSSHLVCSRKKQLSTKELRQHKLAA